MLRRSLLILGLGLALGACGSDSSTEASATIAGTWNLQSVNGSALPFVILQSGANKAEILSDVITISGTGSFTQTTTVRTTVNGAATTQSVADAGTYTLSGSAITLRFNSDNSTGTGSWSGNTITATADGFAYVYKR
jgi:hypothetical protein